MPIYYALQNGLNVVQQSVLAGQVDIARALLLRGADITMLAPVSRKFPFFRSFLVWYVQHNVYISYAIRTAAICLPWLALPSTAR